MPNIEYSSYYNNLFNKYNVAIDMPTYYVLVMQCGVSSMHIVLELFEYLVLLIFFILPVCMFMYR